MENSIIVKCNDISLNLDSKGKIIGDFTCFDLDTMNIPVLVHQQIKAIYRQTKITKDFIKRLEYKIKLTLRLRPVMVKFLNKKGQWILQTPLYEVYEPVTLNTRCIKAGDNPITIDGKVVNFFSNAGKIFLVCLVEEIDTESNNFVQKLKTITITEEVNAIYNDNETKRKFREILNIKFKYKKAFLDVLAKHLEGKTLKLEYDEHFEYTLSTILYDFIVVTHDNK